MSNSNSGFRLATPPVTGMLKPNIALKQFLTTSIVPVAKHLFQILPDATFVFISLFSILTQNFALGTLTISLIESLLAFTLFGKGVNYFIGEAMTSGNVERPDGCQAGFPSSIHSYSTLSIFSNFTTTPFPSYPIALLSTLIGYVLAALFQYSPEMTQLGSSWQLRIPIATTCSFLVLTAFVLFRYIAGCENLGIITGTLIIGLLMGTLLAFQNRALFGKEAMNVLGLPTLHTKTVDGDKPLYVCEKSS